MIEKIILDREADQMSFASYNLNVSGQEEAINIDLELFNTYKFSVDQELMDINLIYHAWTVCYWLDIRQV